MKTLKKHKYKFLLALILLVALGGTAYYFKQKEATKKAKMEGEQEAPKDTTGETQPKEPAVIKKPKEDPIEKQVATKHKDLVLNTKGNKQLAKA